MRFLNNEGMELEKQVCSLELAKRLKELGVKQESLWHWVRRGHHFFDGVEIQPDEPRLYETQPPFVFPYESVGSAFSVAELGEMLPMEIKSNGAIYTLETWRQYSKDMRRWFTSYVHADGRKNSLAFQMEKTEADARAKCLIYLIENKLVTIDS
jgi:hypothetical protein